MLDLTLDSDPGENHESLENEKKSPERRKKTEKRNSSLIETSRFEHFQSKLAQDYELWHSETRNALHLRHMSWGDDTVISPHSLRLTGKMVDPNSEIASNVGLCSSVSRVSSGFDTYVTRKC